MLSDGMNRQPEGFIGAWCVPGDTSVRQGKVPQLLKFPGVQHDRFLSRDDSVKDVFTCVQNGTRAYIPGQFQSGQKHRLTEVIDLKSGAVEVTPPRRRFEFAFADEHQSALLVDDLFHDSGYGLRRQVLS
jgi:hypothetical protein